MKQMVLAAAVFICGTLACADFDFGIGAAYAKLGRSASPKVVRATERKMLGAVSRREVSPRARAHFVKGKSSSRKSLAVKHVKKSRLVANHQAARRKKLNRLASREMHSGRRVAMLGFASFYSEDRITASGESFDKQELTAAHPTLPFGTRLRVTNMWNGRSVTVRINDRGPFIHGRIIDVTSAAAKVLGMLDSGVVKVSLDIVR